MTTIMIIYMLVLLFNLLAWDIKESEDDKK